MNYSYCKSDKNVDLYNFLCGVVDGGDDKFNVNKACGHLIRPIRMFKKSEYCDIIKEKREEFILNNFSSEIENISTALRQDAKNFKDCNHTCYFTIPELYDLAKVEMMLQEYFRDCGYLVVLSRDDKNSSRIIKIVLS